jgi:hypothetical protein
VGEQELAILEIARLLRRAFAGGSRYSTAVDDGDGINREQESSRQLHEGSRSDRRCDREELGEQRVEHGKGVRICHEARDLDHAGKAASGIFEYGLQIRECLARLRLEGIARNVSGRRIDSGLARGVNEVADAYRLRVGTKPGDASALDDFRW